ncbi:MAG: homocysteine S-methyltransferase family protein [Candidatus Latescibacterota bacterium]|nr:MAG: homocysteine S-methyltransferase family protein [Candidatus Latescibacterota bacterium]
MSKRFAQLLDEREVILLDGATGTELQRRGVPTPLPLWTGDAARRAPEVLKQIHLDYLAAGVDVVTANTFRTTPYTMRKLGNADDAVELTQRSVALAREACNEVAHGLVAGSLAPLEDCFHPELVPAHDVLAAEHAAHARNLRDAGVDLLLVETMNTTREAHAAAEAALQTGLPVLVSLILDPQGEGDLLSGEDLDVVWAHIRPLPVAGFLVNCSPHRILTKALGRMQWRGDARPIGAYANFGSENVTDGWTPDTTTPAADYGRVVATWRELGARIIGGCCGTSPEHLRAAREVITTTP